MELLSSFADTSRRIVFGVVLVCALRGRMQL